jgi:hypothetical protein
MIDVSNFILDKKCYIRTKENKYLYCSFHYDHNTKKTEYCFRLSDKCLEDQLFDTYSIKNTSFVCNKVSTIKSKNTNMYINDIPSYNPIPLLIIYNHYDNKIFTDPIYTELRWAYERRIIHNMLGEALCYKIKDNENIELFFQRRNYEAEEDYDNYLIYDEY